ncbi:MAG: hypothetical protein IJ974_00855 [Phascolarctobacterium sp.]|nr:hypothetical protein [Phascolarctobacterium sp.]MBR2219527.1 hypothetical protein [Phascolarctobacterium sp.]MBR6636725.1 hypothetical protein [Phascolarctobacterium sp.]
MEMLKEGGVYSLPRVLCFEIVHAWLITTALSMILDKHFYCYGEFTAATVACIGYLIGNKFINSKYNTPLGEIGKPKARDKEC